MLRIFPDPRDPAHAASGSTPQCRHLIVVCSPQSACDARFAEQIRAFKKAEGEERVIVFIVDADPERVSEADEASDEWVPAWLRWRLTENGTFRRAEPSEPLIIDARSGRMNLPEARAHLLAALLDVPREEIRAFQDLVTPEAAVTLAAPEADIVEAGQPKANRGGAPWLRAAAVLMLAAGAAFIWVKVRPVPARELAFAESESSGDAVQVPAATTVKTAPSAPAGPLLIAAASPRPTLETAPAPLPTVITSVALPALPEATPLPIAAPSREPARIETPRPAAVIAFRPSDGPQTPIRTAPQTLTRPHQLTSTSAWRGLRDLGDTLLERGNRDAGMVALAQAAEIALKAADTSTADGEKIEIARMCLRVGALQKQYFTPKDSRHTLEGGLRILERMHQSEVDADERAALMENLSQLLQGSRE